MFKHKEIIIASLKESGENQKRHDDYMEKIRSENHEITEESEKEYFRLSKISIKKYIEEEKKIASRLKASLMEAGWKEPGW